MLSQISNEKIKYILRIVFSIFFVFSFATLNPVVAQSSQFTGESSDAINDSKKTEILVLATPHLSQIDDNFSPTLLDSLISVLENYSPHVIGIEALSGVQIAEMKRRGGSYESVLENFAEEQLKYGQKAQEALTISWRKADMVADSLLKKVQNAPKVAVSTRLELINYLLASYRLHTAALQWSYVSKDHKSDQSIIPKSSATALAKTLNSANENASISLRLAHKLNLQRIYPIDDHFDKGPYYSKIRPQLSKALDDSTVQTVRNAPYRRKHEHLIEQGIKDSTLYAMYKFMNSPAFVKQDKKIQWRNTFLQTEQFNEILRKRLALWEFRNLKIAAHIRKASTHSPGGRILITIGGSHKAFLDSYLKEMLGVEVVSLSDIVNK